jgi:transketolase
MTTSTGDAGRQASKPPLSNLSLADRAYHIRRHALRMGEVPGQG